MHATPSLAKCPLIFSYSSIKCLAKISVIYFTKWFTIYFKAPACCWLPFQLSKHRLSNSLYQHQSNSQAQLSNLTREDFKRFKRKSIRSLSECIPMYQSSLQCDFCIPNHLVTRPVTQGRASPPLEKLSPPLRKCLGHIVCLTIVFVHAIDVKFWTPSENSSPLWCPKLVTGLLVTVAL